MNSFSLMLKHELRARFPGKRKNGGIDIVGTVLSVLITLAIAGVVIFLVTTILDSYVTVKIDKVNAPQERSLELLNLLYTVIIAALAVMTLERMRTTLANPADREIFLRLPVKKETIFFAKLLTLMITNHMSAVFMILPVNVIFYIVLRPEPLFWLLTFLVWLLMPLVSFLIAAVLIVPYIKVIDFMKNKYVLLFIILSAALIGAFSIYAEFLAVVQGLFETGTIKFLFNADFVDFLSGLLEKTYPAVSFARIALSEGVGSSWIIVLAVGTASLVFTYFITKRLYYVTLYKNTERRKVQKRPRRKARSTKFSALLGKEFISVFREPKYMFSYFAISAAMPVMVYSCYTLFETLILNALGFRVPFSLALITILMFNILTNTFCSTNITRDGETTLKVKVLPVKAAQVMLAKVIFCCIVSMLSITVSAGLLIYTTSLELADGLICLGVALVFSLSQILVATRLDLNGASVTATHAEMERKSSQTIAKTVTLGLILCVLVGMSSMIISLLVAGESSVDIGGITLRSVYAYIIPIAVSAVYCALAVLFYVRRLEKKFEALVR